MTARINGLTTGTQYGTVSGIATMNATEANITQLSPNASIVAGSLSVLLTNATGVLGTRTFTIRDDRVNTSPAVQCTIAAGLTNTTCTSSATATIAAGSELSISVTITGAPASTDALIGWRATTP